MIHTYIGEKPRHTHENIGLENFLESLKAHWGSSAETITVIAHSLWNGADIDAVCILPRAIAIVDFKSHGGRIQISENGAWQGDGGLIKGGNKLNPFAQVRDNKRAVISWLEDKKLLPHCNLGHISGGVIFMRPVIIEGDLGPKIGRWFHVTDLERCGEVSASLASPQIAVDAQQSRLIIDALGVRESRSLRLRPRIVSVDGSSETEPRQPKLTEKQQEVLDAIVRFLKKNPDRKSLSVLGMTHTGKTRLLVETRREIEKIGRQPVVLAPNVRIARRLDCGLACDSIYTHIFDRSKAKAEKTKTGTTDQPREVMVFPVKKPCEDPVDCVYLIDEAHLIGNDLFEMEDGKRYGTGHLFDDFVEFSDLKASRRQVVFFGDPFQLPRGRREAMPIFGDLQRARGLAATEVNLTEMFEAASRSVPLANARHLAEAISAGQFSVLHLESGEGFALLSRQEASERARTFFQQQLDESWFIADTHAKTLQFNRWIRRQLFSQESVQPIVTGDLLEFYYGQEGDAEPFVASARSLVSGDRLVVKEAPKPSIRRSQVLKRMGGGESITFTTRRVDVSSGEIQISLVLLEDFLLAERPELDRDVAVALEVWQKDNLDEPVCRARYGYASTAHHAQGIFQPVCLVDAGYDGGRHTDSYFRWLYTAITRASHQCYVFNFRDLDPFDEAQWSDRGSQRAKSLPIGGGWRFASDPIKATLGPGPGTPASNSGDQASQRSEFIARAIRKPLESLAWQITGVTSAPYQEQYQLRGPESAEVRLFVSYNQMDEVTGMRVSDAAVGHVLLVEMAEAAVQASLGDSGTQLIVRCVRERAATKSLRVVGAHRNGEYRLTVMLLSDNTECAQIEINHDKNGIVSTVRLVKFTGSHIAEDARTALVSTGDGI